MNIINLTPHTITLRQTDGTDRVIESSGVARCEQEETEYGEVDSVPIIHIDFGSVYGLPEFKPGTIYIVSALVAAAVKGQRFDVFCPARLIRDEQNRVIGAAAIARV